MQRCERACIVIRAHEAESIESTSASRLASGQVEEVSSQPDRQSRWQREAAGRLRACGLPLDSPLHVHTLANSSPARSRRGAALSQAASPRSVLVSSSVDPSTVSVSLRPASLQIWDKPTESKVRAAPYHAFECCKNSECDCRHVSRAKEKPAACDRPAAVAFALTSEVMRSCHLSAHANSQPSCRVLRCTLLTYAVRWRLFRWLRHRLRCSTPLLRQQPGSNDAFQAAAGTC